MFGVDGEAPFVVNKDRANGSQSHIRTIPQWPDRPLRSAALECGCIHVQPLGQCLQGVGLGEDIAAVLAVVGHVGVGNAWGR